MKRMKASRYSKAALEQTLKACALCIVLCALAVGFATSRRTAAEERNQRAEQSIREARSRLARAKDYRLLLDTYRERYERLVHAGVLVRFDRAVASDWFEAALRAKHRTLIEDYSVGKDALYTGPETAELTAFKVVAHRLEFRAAAADEDEFAELMQALATRVPGTTSQEACSITRNRESGDLAELLSLRCAVVWYEFAPSTTDLAGNQAGS